MDTPKQLLQTSGNDDNAVASTSSSKVLDSPKTPVRTPLDDSLEDCDTDEMESPQFPHLIPVYHRRNSHDRDLEGVRIGWDDGFGSVCYQDDDYGIGKNGKRLKRSRSGRLFTERRHHSLFGSHKVSSTNSPSPRHNINNDVIQAELNDYLGCILNCLSAKKRNRQLLKAKNDANSTKIDSTENNNVSYLLNDSADDEMMMICSQAIEKSIAADNYNQTEGSSTSSKSHFSSIPGISPLENTIDTTNENIRSQCSTITSHTENKLPKNTNNSSSSASSTVTNSNNDFSSSLNDSLASDDDLFSALDLSAIEKQVMSDVKDTTYPSVTQKCNSGFNKQQPNTNILNEIENKTDFSSLTNSKNNTSSTLWRRSSSSSSIVNKQLQFQQEKSKSVISRASIISNNNNNEATIKRYCTPAEIEAKRERARRTLMLKFKSKNKSAL